VVFWDSDSFFLIESNYGLASAVDDSDLPSFSLHQATVAKQRWGVCEALFVDRSVGRSVIPYLLPLNAIKWTMTILYGFATKRLYHQDILIP
jgi:hypothetical protein